MFYFLGRLILSAPTLFQIEFRYCSPPLSHMAAATTRRAPARRMGPPMLYRHVGQRWPPSRPWVLPLALSFVDATTHDPLSQIGRLLHIAALVHDGRNPAPLRADQHSTTLLPRSWLLAIVLDLELGVRRDQERERERKEWMEKGRGELRTWGPPGTTRLKGYYIIQQK